MARYWGEGEKEKERKIKNFKRINRSDADKLKYDAFHRNSQIAPQTWPDFLVIFPLEQKFVDLIFFCRCQFCGCTLRSIYVPNSCTLHPHLKWMNFKGKW